MNEPFNIDEDGMFYDVPPTPPHTLTDERAGYDAPSEAAMEIANEFVLIDNDTIYLNGAKGQIYITKTPISQYRAENMVQAIAHLVHEQTVQAVAAREAEIAAIVSEVCDQYQTAPYGAKAIRKGILDRINQL